MSLIKQIEDMKNSGKSDSQIVTDLRNQGYMPKDIEDSLAQFQVKAAVSNEYSMDPSMQQSILSQAPSPSVPVPSPNSNFQVPSPVNNQEYSTNSYGAQQYDSPSYSDDSSQYYSQNANSETISEVAEQIFDQKIGKIKNELSKVDDFKSETDNKINLLKDRIKRIEGIIDTLQDSIIRKIGEYGQNIQDLGSDLKMTQDSFSKVISPLVQKAKSRSVKRVRKKKK